MTAKYSRPTIAVHDYFDDERNPVTYGYARPANRPGGIPPGVNSFSNQDRYEPIFIVADALIAYLSETFDSCAFEIESVRVQTSSVRSTSIHSFPNSSTAIRAKIASDAMAAPYDLEVHNLSRRSADSEEDH